MEDELNRDNQVYLMGKKQFLKLKLKLKQKIKIIIRINIRINNPLP